MTAEEEIQVCSQMAERVEEVGGQSVVREMVAVVALEEAVGGQNELEWAESDGLEVVAREEVGEEHDGGGILTALLLPHRHPRFHSPHIAKLHVVVQKGVQVVVEGGRYEAYPLTAAWISRELLAGEVEVPLVVLVVVAKRVWEMGVVCHHLRPHQTPLWNNGGGELSAHPYVPPCLLGRYHSQPHTQ